MKFTKASLIFILSFVFLFLPQKIFAEDRFISYKITDQIPVEPVLAGEVYLEKEILLNYTQGTVTLSSISGGYADILASDTVEIIAEHEDGRKFRQLYFFRNSIGACVASQPVIVKPYQDITPLLNVGLNKVTVRIFNYCSNESKFTSDLYLVNNVDKVVYSTDFINAESVTTNKIDWNDANNMLFDDVLLSAYKYVRNSNPFVESPYAYFSGYDFSQVPDEAKIIAVVPYVDGFSKNGYEILSMFPNGLNQPNSRSAGLGTSAMGLDQYMYPVSWLYDTWGYSQKEYTKENLSEENGFYLKLALGAVRGYTAATHNINWVPIKIYYELPEDPEPPPPPFNGKVLNVPSFKQGLYPFDSIDPVWENDIYDSSNIQTLWCGSALYQCGCAMTSASMVLSFFGINFDFDGNPVNPQSLNNFFAKDPIEKNGIVTSWGYYYGDFRWNRLDDYTALANRIYPEQTKLDQPIIEDYSFEKLKSYIDQNLPVILKVIRSNGGIHYVLAKGYEDEDKIIINDPAKDDPSEGYQYLVDYVPATKRSMIVYKPTHSDFSNIEILIPNENQILLIDKYGRKTGFDPVQNKILEEIPNSSYFYVELISDITSENSPPENNGYYDLIINLPEDGAFKIIPVDNNQEKVEYSMYISDSDANSKYYVFEADDNFGEEFEYINSIDNQFIKMLKMDIRPWNVKNKIVAKSNSLVPVVIFGESDFEVKNIDFSSVRLGEANVYKPILYKKIKDLNYDGHKDVILRFKQNKINIDKNVTELCLTGNTKENLSFKSCDYVLVK